MTTQEAELGALGIILLTTVTLGIKGFWDYLKTRKDTKVETIIKEEKVDTNSLIEQIMGKVLVELEQQNNNHLHTIESKIADGFSQMIQCGSMNTRDIVEAINNMHIDIVKEIGKLR